MDDFGLKIKKEFLNEAPIDLEEVESSIMELESALDPKPLLAKVFRLVHDLPTLTESPTELLAQKIAKRSKRLKVLHEFV